MLSNKQVILMAGYPGSGKSTLAKRISQKFGHVHLSSDQMRLDQFKQERYDQAGDEAVGPKRADAYKLMYQKAHELLATNQPVILDATHVEPSKWQEPFAELVTRISPQTVCFVLVNHPKEIINQRMSQQQQPNGSSETVYQAWKRVYGYFEEKEHAVLIAWPDSSSGVEIISYADILSELD